MRVVIVEDEPLATERLTKMLRAYDEGIVIEAQLDTVKSAVGYFKNGAAPDLIFLDIELGDGKSFDIFTQVPVSSYIIFVTAFNEYAVQAFKYNSLDYLLKPLKKEDLYFAINKYKAQAAAVRPLIDLEAVREQLQGKQSTGYKTRFLVKRGPRFFSVQAKDVAQVYTRERVHFIKTLEGTDYIVDGNLDELEGQLSPETFFRANRQFIINYNTIAEVVSWFDGKLKLVLQPASYEEIIVSRLKASEFKAWLDK